ncbi:hypothetical protein ALC56_05571, partial [Trachymyrmex septentrionalis]
RAIRTTPQQKTQASAIITKNSAINHASARHNKTAVNRSPQRRSRGISPAPRYRQNNGSDLSRRYRRECLTFTIVGNQEYSLTPLILYAVKAHRSKRIDKKYAGP